MGTSRALSGAHNSLSKIYPATGSDPAEIKAVGLRYVANKQPGISRAPDGERFHDVAPDGHVVADNTPAICRKRYVHPGVLDMCLDGTLLHALEQRAEQELVDSLHSLRPEEAAVMALLSWRLSEEAAK